MERERERERVGVVVDEVDNMLGCERSEEVSERGVVEWFGFGVENGFIGFKSCLSFSF